MKPLTLEEIEEMEKRAAEYNLRYFSIEGTEFPVQELLAMARLAIEAREILQIFAQDYSNQERILAQKWLSKFEGAGNEF
jgi:hypothetical protein